MNLLIFLSSSNDTQKLTLFCLNHFFPFWCEVEFGNAVIKYAAYFVVDGHMQILIKNWTESRSLASVNSVSVRAKCWTRVGSGVMLKWWTRLKLDWWNNVWRFCNPQLCPWDYSPVLHQRAEIRHDSVTVKYCSPALSGRQHSEQQGILLNLSTHLTERVEMWEHNEPFDKHESFLEASWKQATSNVRPWEFGEWSSRINAMYVRCGLTGFCPVEDNL